MEIVITVLVVLGLLIAAALTALSLNGKVNLAWAVLVLCFTLLLPYMLHALV